MAVLPDPERAALHANFMREASRTRQNLPLAKLDLRAAIDAIDSWVEANKASFNSAIPLPARTALTAAQKAQLLVFVVTRRFETGS